MTSAMAEVAPDFAAAVEDSDEIQLVPVVNGTTLPDTPDTPGTTDTAGTTTGENKELGEESNLAEG